MSLRLVSIEIEAFRGFTDLAQIDLDGDAVVVTGANGSGKTSLIDAITWAFTGRIDRLQERRYRKNEEFIVSTYRPGGEARVRVKLRSPDGDLDLERRGTSATSLLTVREDKARRDGGAATARLASLLGGSPDELPQRLSRSILEQEALRAVLEAGPEHLYSRLRDLLGLGILQGFEEAVDRLRRRRLDDLNARRSTQASAESRVRDLRARLEQSLRELSESGAAEDALAGVSRVAADESQWIQLTNPTAAETVQRDLAAVRECYESVRVGRDRIATLSDELTGIVVPPDGEVASLAAELVDANRRRGELVQQVQQLSVAAGAARERAGALGALAAAALPLLGEHCPVCGQAIVHDQVEQMLAAHQSSAGAELISLQGSAALVRSELDATELRTQQLQRTIALIEASRKSRHELSDQIQAVWLSMDRQPVPVLSLHGLRPRSLSAIDETLGSIVRLGQALSSAASAVRRFELEGRLGVLRGQLDQAEAELGRLEAEAAGAARRHTESDSLLKAVRESSVEVVASSLRLVNPVFSQVYRRLSPHPTFTDLGLEHDLYRQKGRSLPVVTDPTAAISANPGVVCSVGQLNVVALSYFLALGITSGTDPLGLVVMDDPLQSLDDVNALGFADFCRQLKRQRQVLLTTHDRRFGSLLRRKLAPRESSETCVFVSFDGWDRRGPSITVERMDGSEPQLLLA